MEGTSRQLQWIMKGTIDAHAVMEMVLFLSVRMPTCHG